MHCQLQWRTSCHGKPTIEIRKLLVHDMQNCSPCNHIKLTCHVCLDEAGDMFFIKHFFHCLQCSSNCILQLFTRLINCRCVNGDLEVGTPGPRHTCEETVYNKRYLCSAIHLTSLHCGHSPSPFLMLDHLLVFQYCDFG
jgi:hypothetical protein